MPSCLLVPCPNTKTQLGLVFGGKVTRAGDIQAFEDIAAASQSERAGGSRQGVEALGVLKADVDHLGMLMTCGLKEDRLTLSRLATLSRQMNLFFTLWLPNFLANSERFREVYTVFAGGDDLLLIGPWNRMRELASEIARAFERYTCRNPNVHLSAGLSFHRPSAPVERMAELSKAALEKAKERRNRVTVFGEVVTWEELDDLASKIPILEDWRQGKQWFGTALLYRLNEFIDMAEQEQNAPALKFSCQVTATSWNARTEIEAAIGVLESLE